MLPQENAWTHARRERDRIMEDAMLVAYAVAAIMGNKEDEISENEAKKLYDAGWLKDRTQRGLLRFSRKGATSKSAKIYSRFEIESLKRAEKNIENSYQRARQKMEEMQRKTLKKS